MSDSESFLTSDTEGDNAGSFQKDIQEQSQVTPAKRDYRREYLQRKTSFTSQYIKRVENSDNPFLLNDGKSVYTNVHLDINFKSDIDQIEEAKRTVDQLQEAVMYIYAKAKANRKEKKIIKQNKKEQMKVRKYFNSITIVCMISLLLVPTHSQYTFCPNNNMLVDYHSDHVNTRYSLCQLPIRNNYDQINLKFQKITRPCIYTIDDDADVVIDMVQQTWTLFFYKNKVIFQDSLSFDVKFLLGVYSVDNHIFFQYSKNPSFANCSQQSQLFNYLQHNKVYEKKQFRNIPQQKYLVKDVWVNQQSGFFYLDPSKQLYRLYDGFWDCQNQQMDPGQIMYHPLNITLHRPILYTEKCTEAEVDKFLAYNYAGLIFMDPTKQRNLASVSDLNNLQQLKADNALQECKFVNGVQQCRYRFLVESREIGHLLRSKQDLSVSVSIPLAYQVYNLLPMDFNCVNSEPKFEYKCYCGLSLSSQQAELNDFVQSSDEQTEFITQVQRYSAYGEDCYVKLKPSNQYITTKEVISGNFSKLYQIQKQGTCIVTSQQYAVQSITGTKLMIGINQCSGQDTYNAIRGDYNMTIFDIKDYSEQIVDDYILVQQNQSYLSYNSAAYTQNSDIIQQICPTKMDKKGNIIFPQRRISFKERSCLDNQADISHVQDFVSGFQNRTKFQIFNRFSNIRRIDLSKDEFFTLSINTPRVFVGQVINPLNVPLFISYEDLPSGSSRQCAIQYSYAVNVQRIVQMLYCTVDQVGQSGFRRVDEVFIVDQGFFSSHQPWLLVDIHYNIVCFNLQNDRWLDCDDVRFTEHAIRPINRAAVEGEISIRGSYISSINVDAQAKDCAISMPLIADSYVISKGKICCQSGELLRLNIYNGVYMQFKLMNLDSNLCYDFSLDNVKIEGTNVEKFTISIPDKQAKLDVVAEITNQGYKPVTFNYTQDASFEDYSFDINYMFWWKYLHLFSFVFLMVSVWVILNSFLNNYVIHGYTKSEKGEKPSLFYILSGGSCMSYIFSKCRKAKANTYDKLMKKKLKSKGKDKERNHEHIKSLMKKV